MKVRHAHIPELQSLRGIAAVVVLLHHCSFLFQTKTSFNFWAELLLNAHAAVVLFFVLSGYVLSRSLSGSPLGKANIFKFYVARFCRIYPGLWLCCIFATFYILVVRTHTATPGISLWYALNSATPTRVQMIMTFLGQPSPLLPPIWSVRVELLASVVMPFLAYLVQRGFGFWLLCASLILAASPVGDHGGLIFLPSFVLGSFAFHYQAKARPYLKNLSIFIVSLIFLLLFRIINPMWRFEIAYNAFVPLIIESCAAAVLVMTLVERRMAFLQSRIIMRLGDISYSVYLLHYTVMSIIATYVATFAISAESKSLILMVLTFAACWPLADMSYRYIELKGIAIGKRIYRRFDNSIENQSNA